MKKTQLCLAILAAIVLATAAPAMAQVRLGPVVDINFANVSTDDPEFKDLASTYMRFGIGGVIEYPLNENLSFVAEPMILGKGSKGEMSEGGATAEGKVKLSYFEVPLLVKYTFGEKGRKKDDAIQPYVLAGPTIGFKTGAKATTSLSGTDMDADLSGTEDISDEVSGTDLGLALGGGVAKGFGSAKGFVEAQYVFGLKNIEKDSDTSTKNKGFQIRVGVTFPLGSK